MSSSEIIDPNKYYSVKEVSGVLGWSVDVIRRLVDRGFMEALVLPQTSGKRRRQYRSMRILGLEILRCIRLLKTGRGR